MNKPLTGVRVLDLSRILAGPWCTQHLADFGAEVIKIEHPQRGDDTRKWGPPFWQDSEQSAYFLCANRGKQSMVVDIATPEGQQRIRELAVTSDVVVENFKVGGLKRYGLDYESLKAINPKLIYCSITGFGQNGPDKDKLGYDFLLQGRGGLMSITGQGDEHPGGGPVKVGVAVVDLFTGMYASTSILSALHGRQHTGEGCHIDISLLDVQVATLANQATNFLTSGQSPQRIGNEHPNIVPYQAFATSSGHMIVAVGNDAQFERFCRVIDCEALLDDARFSSNRGRVQHRGELIPLLEMAMHQRSSEEWIALFNQHGVPCGPINNIEQVFDDPQIQYRGMKLNLKHPEYGEVALVGNPVRMNGISQNSTIAPPLHGQDKL